MRDLQNAVTMLLLDDEPCRNGPDGHLPDKTRLDCLETVWEAFKKELPKARGSVHG